MKIVFVVLCALVACCSLTEGKLVITIHYLMWLLVIAAMVRQLIWQSDIVTLLQSDVNLNTSPSNILLVQIFWFRYSSVLVTTLPIMGKNIANRSSTKLVPHVLHYVFYCVQ